MVCTFIHGARREENLPSKMCEENAQLLNKAISELTLSVSILQNFLTFSGAPVPLKHVFQE